MRVLKVIAAKIHYSALTQTKLVIVKLPLLLIVRYHTVIYDTMWILRKKLCRKYEWASWENISWSVTWTRNCQSV